MPAGRRNTRRSSRRTRHHRQEPRPSISDPRPHLLDAVLTFVQAVQDMPGVRRIGLLGSLTTDKPVPKDADVLVVIDEAVDFDVLAQRARRLKGIAQGINLAADIFLADETGRYIGRVCRHRECHDRMSCEARHCGRRQHLNDDLDVITLAPTVIAEPPVDLHPRIIRRCAVPADVASLLLAPLAEASSH